jgi:hypothetical protein
LGDIRKVLVLSDMHCGSTVGLLPPGCKTLEGTALQANDVQQWVWDCWVDFHERWLPTVIGPDEPYAVVLNGDLVEGIHHGTKQVMSPDLADQWSIACTALQPVVDKADKTFIIVGTETHTHSVEHSLAHHFEAVPSPTKPAWDRLDLTVNGCRVRFVHHISTTSRVYLAASRLSINLGNMQLESMRAGHPVPTVLCAAHAHRFDEYADGRGMAVCGPSWQGLTRFAYKVVSNAVPSVGGYVLDWTDRPHGSLPHARARVYMPEAPEGVEL